MASELVLELQVMQLFSQYPVPSTPTPTSQTRKKESGVIQCLTSRTSQKFSLL